MEPGQNKTTAEKCLLAVKIVYTFIMVALLIGVVAVAFIMKGKWNLLSLGFADIGVYGLVIFGFLVLQQLFSMANNLWWIPKIVRVTEELKRFPKTNIQVVGYREDPKLFRSCLTSLSKQNYSNLGQILVGIDGNHEKDLKMEEVFEEVFPMGIFIKLEKTFYEMSVDERRVIQEITQNHKYVCISQPHKGKRDIMYTCFHSHSDSTQLVALTDSDTMWEEDTLLQLVKVMVGHDEYRERHNQKILKRREGKQNVGVFSQKLANCQGLVKECGSVTGDVGIWNKENYLSYLSALRYWFAFNVERAADSYFGVVNCVSGPLGLYKREHLQQISHDWIEQSFMGEKCTFGDDRALSNRILEKGLSIFYTPLARCETDTPAELLRWIPQQTRWCKSFYREFLFNVRSFYKHSIWMSAELAFQLVYPFFIIVTLIWFITHSIDLLMIVFSFIVIMGTLRGLFGFFRTWKLQFLHYSIYVFLYILFLIPSKLWALLTLWNNEWGTSTRLVRYRNVLKALHALIWAAGLTAYYAFFFVKHLFVDQMNFQLTTLLVAAGCVVFCLALVVHWKFWGTYFLVPQVSENLDEKYCDYKQHNQKKKFQYFLDSRERSPNANHQRAAPNQRECQALPNAIVQECQDDANIQSERVLNYEEKTQSVKADLETPQTTYEDRTLKEIGPNIQNMKGSLPTIFQKYESRFDTSINNEKSAEK